MHFQEEYLTFSGVVYDSNRSQSIQVIRKIFIHREHTFMMHIAMMIA